MSSIRIFRLFISVFSLWSLVFLNACQKMPSGGIPIYVLIDSPSVNITDIKQGSASQKISDVWAYAGPQTLGAFEMPVKIPVLAEGEIPFLFNAGIKDNGIANTRIVYPFYQADTFTIRNAERGKTYFHHPVYRYKLNVGFALNETFETGNAFTGMSPETNEVFEGSRSGKIFLGANDTFKAAYHTAGFQIPPTGREVYLEMNYKSDAPFTVGISGITGTNQTNYPKIVLGAKSSWNKIYINFNNEVGTANAAKYSLYFQVAKPTGQSTATIYLDNLKIVHYE